jgi:hypothetical protein
LARVACEEVLYRLVKIDYVELENGEWRPTQDAFLGGSERRISVYRAALVNNDPSSLPRREPGYVCRFTAGQARTIDRVKRTNPESGETEKYKVCVEATPEEGNHVAHADVYSHPPAPSNKARRDLFRLLKEALKDLAKWEPRYSPSDGTAE